ncbi:MAG: TrbL/VirB6 plasmid conjugal transfer protein [Gammaproteobacteria bacterium]|jgi:type IV secretion system protein VirB6|nr:TrbL/VirB6 plasmid conjugal transfer protein [Gammaproteobacteria bacterium]
MGFFAEFSAWLNGLLSAYIGDTTGKLAAALEPAVVTLGTLYVMIWGFLHLTGKIEEPVLEGLKRIAILALVFGVGINLWHYNDVIVATFFQAPGQLAAVVIGADDSVTVVDTIIDRGDAVGSALLTKGGVFHGLSFTLAGVAVYLAVGVTAIYTMFLLALSRVALSILLALGPLIIPLFLFDATRRFVEAWFAQLTNYALIAILSVLVAALMMTLIDRAASAAQAAGGGITFADAVRVCMAAGLTFLLMRQVLPMASALASGVALGTFGVVSSSIAWARRQALTTSGHFLRGAALDRDTNRWDPLARKAGYYVGAGVRKVKNAIRPANSLGH